MSNVKICNNKKNYKIERLFLYDSGRGCFEV